ncbi:MAG: TonB-dependent receptor [candidate division Zixibacteria bacterium]|nr:TonB-dependent receptor [candidate division Zixibacteria bacterium]
MRYMFTLLLLSAFLAGSPEAAPVAGTVVNTDREPLPGVTVAANQSGIGTLTDSSGHFSIDLPPGVTRLTFSSVGYHSRQFALTGLPDTVVLDLRYYRGSAILVRAERAEAGVSPIAFSNVSKDDIEKTYTVGEFPLLLEPTPNLHTFTDGGSPLGYSYTLIRGFSDKQVTTYINGVPLNDPEDQATYFVDLPDFAANISDIQVQRGVGNSLYGDGSFGGSINVVTNALARPRQATVTTGYGELTHDGKRVSDIYKQSVEYSSGLVDGAWHFGGRFSRQKTGGYRHRSWYNGWSYYFSLARLDPNMTTELYIYGGPIKTHLSYYGSTLDDIRADRRHNPLTYGNETDNFNQPHYHLHNAYTLNERMTLHNTLYYIRGTGYYEQLKTGETFAEYGVDPSVISDDPDTGEPYDEGDIVRQQWVKKNQVGWNPRLDISHDRGRHSVGGSFYFFDSDHYGLMVWAQHLASDIDPQYKYYQYFGRKRAVSVFAEEYYRITDRISAQAVAQVRYQDYRFDQVPMGMYRGLDYDVDWVFFSPRLGVSYAVSDRVDVFSNLAVSSRMPTDASIYDANDPTILPSLEVVSVDDDSTRFIFGDPLVENERLFNLEVGGVYRSESIGIGLNLFWMNFENQIIPYGGRTENGLAITVNADRAVHSGAELTLTAKPHPSLDITGNFSVNHNRIEEFKNTFDVYYFDDSPTGVSDSIDFSGNVVPGFPEYIANLRIGYTHGGFYGAIGMRLVGKQYVEVLNIDSLAIDQYATAAISAAYTIRNAFGLGDVTIAMKIDNLFDEDYIASGYGYSYGLATDPGVVVERDDLITEGEYFVGPERSYFAELKWQLF